MARNMSTAAGKAHVYKHLTRATNAVSDICSLYTFQLNITSPLPFPKANRKQANLSAIQANQSAI